MPQQSSQNQNQCEQDQVFPGFQPLPIGNIDLYHLRNSHHHNDSQRTVLHDSHHKDWCLRIQNHKKLDRNQDLGRQSRSKQYRGLIAECSSKQNHLNQNDTRKMIINLQTTSQKQSMKKRMTIRINSGLELCNLCYGIHVHLSPASQKYAEQDLKCKNTCTCTPEPASVMFHFLRVQIIRQKRIQ